MKEKHICRMILPLPLLITCLCLPLLPSSGWAQVMFPRPSEHIPPEVLAQCRALLATVVEKFVPTLEETFASAPAGPLPPEHFRATLMELDRARFYETLMELEQMEETLGDTQRALSLLELMAKALLKESQGEIDSFRSLPHFDPEFNIPATYARLGEEEKAVESYISLRRALLSNKAVSIKSDQYTIVLSSAAGGSNSILYPRPTSLMLAGFLANNLAAGGHYERALKWVEKLPPDTECPSEAECPFRSGMLNGIAQAAASRRDFDEALRIALSIPFDQSRFESLDCIAQNLAAAGQPSRAMEVANIALQQAKGKDPGLSLTLSTLINRGYFPEALTLTQQLPSTQDYLSELVLIAYDMLRFGKTEEAKSVLLQAMKKEAAGLTKEGEQSEVRSRFDSLAEISRLFSQMGEQESAKKAGELADQAGELYILNRLADPDPKTRWQYFSFAPVKPDSPPWLPPNFSLAVRQALCDSLSLTDPTKRAQFIMRLVRYLDTYQDNPRVNISPPPPGLLKAVKSIANPYQRGYTLAVVGNNLIKSGSTEVGLEALQLACKAADAIPEGGEKEGPTFGPGATMPMRRVSAQSLLLPAGRIIARASPSKPGVREETDERLEQRSFVLTKVAEALVLAKRENEAFALLQQIEPPDKARAFLARSLAAAGYPERAFRLAQDIQSPQAKGNALDAVAISYAHAGRFFRALDIHPQMEAQVRIAVIAAEANQPGYALILAKDIAKKYSVEVQLQNIAVAFAKGGYTEEALQVDDLHHDLAAKTDTLIKAAEELTKMQKRATALQMLRRAHGLALDIPEPFDRSRSLCRIGSLLTDLDARDEAISTFDQALAIGPKSWTAGNALQGLLRLGQKEKLVQALRDGLQEAKNQPNPLARVSAFIHLASLFIKAEDYEDAASALEQGTQALGEALPSVQATSTPTQRALHLDDIISSIKAMMQLVPSS